jgi:hypothetical protein
MADLALLLDAQDLIEIDARNRRESGAFAGRRDGEAGVVSGQVNPANEGVAAAMSVRPASASSLTRRS